MRQSRREAPGKMDFELWRRCRDEDIMVMERVRWRPECCGRAREQSRQKKIQMPGAEKELGGVREHGEGGHVLKTWAGVPGWLSG